MADRTRRGRKRRRRSQAEIRKIVERYRASGQSQAAFGAASGVALSSLSYWLRKEREGGVGGARIVPVELVDSPGAMGWFEVVLSNDRMVRVPMGFDQEALGALLSVVDRSC